MPTEPDIDWERDELILVLDLYRRYQKDGKPTAHSLTQLSGELGRPVEARQVPREALVGQFVGMGAGPDYAAGLVTLYEAIGSDGYSSDPRTPDTTTPTTLDAYVADTLRPTFTAMPAPDASPVTT